VNEPARYAVGYESAARKELGKLDKQAARRIARAVSALGSNPRPAGCRRLVGYDDLWRIRIGSSSCNAPQRAWRFRVRTTLALDDDLVSEAQRLTGTSEKSALVRQALRALIERESARRLAQLAGSEP